MTSRYTLYETDQLRDRFALENGLPKGVKPHYNISPTQKVPVILSQDGKHELTQMLWGFVAVGAKDTNSVFRYKTFTARSEAILDKPIWRSAVRTQRCLIPANGFYEWKQLPTGKRAYYLRPTHHQLFGFAGIYNEWTDPAGVTHGTCAIITIDSETDDDMTPSRLPVIVEPADEADWLNPDLNDLSTLFGIMRPYDPDALEIVPVSDAINSTKVDSPDLITRIVR